MTLTWTKRAKIRFEEILDYIEEEFGHAAREKKIRGFQISRQTRLFYRVRGNRITILTFFDNRQDPKKRIR